MTSLSPPAFSLTNSGGAGTNTGVAPAGTAAAPVVQRVTDYNALAEQIHEAIDGWGTDEDAVYRALEAVRGDYQGITELQRVYQSKYGVSLLADIRGDFSGGELARCMELLNSGNADAVVDEVESMEGDEMTWVPSSPGQADVGGGTIVSLGSNDFASWALAPAATAAPPVAQVTTINCWEMVLLAAHNAGFLSWQQIHDTYTSRIPATTIAKIQDPDPAVQAVGQSEIGPFVDGLLYSLMTSGPAQTFDVGDPATPMPNRGDVVFFDGAAHVALATGSGEEIFTFWPPPNTAFTAGGTVDAVKRSTITELSDWMDVNFGARPSVTFYAPSW